MNWRYGRLGGLLVVILGLTACGLLAPRAPEIDPSLRARWEEHRARIQPVVTWTVQGAMAVNGGAENFDARLHWRRQPERYQLRLNGPLGQGAVLIQGSPRGVTLRTADGQRRVAASPDELFRDLTELDLPISILVHWIRGLPDPDQAFTLLGIHPDGSLERFRQRDWDVRYRETQTVAGLILPRRIWLENDTYLVKLVIHRWRLPQADLKPS